MSEELAIVQTVDFFTPVLDDPFDFGRVGAANALSDVYAMGARPLFALNLVAYPKELSMDVLGEILRGGQVTADAAGIAVVGGHSIDDAEPKYGMCVTGAVHPKKVLTNSGGRPGDVLVLTKPLGSGVITTALKRGLATESQRSTVTELMASLNRDAGEAALAAQASAVTDVTGFGLLGHLLELIEASDTGAEVRASAVPVLDGVIDLVADGVYPGGSASNLRWVSAKSDFDEGIDQTTRLVLADAQTSGGLLIAVPEERLDIFFEALADGTKSQAAVVGRLLEGPPRIRVDP